MRSLFLILILLGCNSKSNNGLDSQNGNDSGNQALYDEVMKVHDEVMPKMNDIYKLKEDLKKEIANAPQLVENKQK